MKAETPVLAKDDWSFLRDSNNLAILDSVAEGVYVVDQNRVVLFWNSGAERLSGFSRADVVGHACHEGILTHCDEKGRGLCSAGCPLAGTISDGRGCQMSVYMHHRDGHRVPVQVRALPIRNVDGDIVGAVETFNDDSVLRATAEKMQKLAELALLDALTGLPNRRCIQSRLDRALSNGGSVAVLLADIDFFKGVNDRWGHDTGDALLRMVSQSLKSAFVERGMVGRWGGEEFLAVLQDLSAMELADIADRARMLVEQSYLTMSCGILRCTISIGATIVCAGESAAVAVDRADRLLYASKAAGRNRVTIEEAPTLDNSPLTCRTGP